MTTRTRIKICGLTRAADVDAAVEAGADAIGFVFYDKSPRHVSLEVASELARALPPFVTPVGLFVNAGQAAVAAAAGRIPGLLLQFHGDETPAQCRDGGRPFLRAVRMAPGIDLLDLVAQFADARGLLLDAQVEGYGGGGKPFDWSLIPSALPLPIVLSGGLDPGNVAEAVRSVRPWAVDVSSGVEVAKGIKDAAMIAAFIAGVKHADV